MPYILVDDFRGGLDTRRLDVTANPGTLVTLKNAHITRGGEIEKRQAFVSLATLPTNTFGLAAAGGQIYVFGSDAASSVNFAVLAVNSPVTLTPSLVVTNLSLPS